MSYVLNGDCIDPGPCVVPLVPGLPVLVPELTYGDLDIREGSSASRLWKEVTLTNAETAEREKVYADLVEYCKLDTWAMLVTDTLHSDRQKINFSFI